MDKNYKDNGGVDLAVLIPCYNEAVTIGDVIGEYKKLFPDSSIYVYDNNSDDDTFLIAQKSGVAARKEPAQGKGNVVRRMFSDVDADIYLMVDGDMTYDSSIASTMVNKLIDENLDMVVCVRAGISKSSYRVGHKIGNHILSFAVRQIFGKKSRDLLSGYRVFSKRFVKTFPSHSKGFDVETELTVHALEMRLPISEINADYYPRPEGSNSKLATYKDGADIIKTIIKLVFSEKPFAAFSLLSLISVICGVSWGWYAVIQPYIETGLVDRIPSAILSTGLVLISLFLFITGVIVQGINKQRKEMFRYNYLIYNTNKDNKNNKRATFKKCT